MGMNKTVYILGAGAPYDMGIPLQSGILESIFGVKPPDESNMDLLKLKDDTICLCLVSAYNIFCEEREILSAFIINNFFSPDAQLRYSKNLEAAKVFEKRSEEYYDNLNWVFNAIKHQNVTLEDLFTIFDKMTIGKSQFHDYNYFHIDKIHDALRHCIIYAFTYICKFKLKKSDTLHKFAQSLVDKRLSVKQVDDCLSVITLNWDTLLESELFDICCKHNEEGVRGKKIYPDLCFYDDPYCTSSKQMVSTHVKAKGRWNIKIMKMHGSLAWLVCPECGRFYTDFTKDIAILEYNKDCCRICRNKVKKGGDNPELHSMLITPTFLKELGNLNIKNIWHNAFIDLSEATEVVFIGYSFPLSDFEMRCLLKQAIHSSTKIKVVLSTMDDPKTYLDCFMAKGYTEKEALKLIEKLSLPAQRYTAFFGGNVEFFYEGINGYLGS